MFIPLSISSRFFFFFFFFFFFSLAMVLMSTYEMLWNGLFSAHNPVHIGSKTKEEAEDHFNKAYLGIEQEGLRLPEMVGHWQWYLGSILGCPKPIMKGYCIIFPCSPSRAPCTPKDSDSRWWYVAVNKLLHPNETGSMFTQQHILISLFRPLAQLPKLPASMCFAATLSPSTRSSLNWWEPFLLVKL